MPAFRYFLLGAYALVAVLYVALLLKKRRWDRISERIRQGILCGHEGCRSGQCLRAQGRNDA